MKNRNLFIQIVPVMLAFFTMGFVDLVGIGKLYQKPQTIQWQTLMPSMVFLWFLIFSVPTGMMIKIGRRKTVLLSIVVTFFALLVPMANYSFVSMLIAFSLLGIGNTLISLNPLVSNKWRQIGKHTHLWPICKSHSISHCSNYCSLGNCSLWKLLYPIFAAIAIMAIVALFFTKIEEKPVEHHSSFSESFSLLKEQLYPHVIHGYNDSWVSMSVLILLLLNY